MSAKQKNIQKQKEMHDTVQADIEQTNIEQTDIEQADTEQADIEQTDIKQTNTESVDIRDTMSDTDTWHDNKTCEQQASETRQSEAAEEQEEYALEELLLLQKVHEKPENNKKRKRKVNKKAGKLVKLGTGFLAALIFAIFFAIPIILTICNSFMTETEITANYGKVFETNKTGSHKFISEKVNLKFIPDKVSFSQYATVLLKSPKYLLKFWNSFFYVVPIVLVQLMIASLAAYGFTRFRGKKREVVFFIYVILTLMPYQVTLVPNYLVAKWLHIFGSRWAILLPGFFSPFSVYLLTKYMRRISTGIIEAAKVDGAGEWKIFTKICMPLCKSALFSVGILVFIDYWNMVEQPLILLADEEKYPLSIFLSKINNGEIGLAFAVAVIYMIPSLLVFLYGEEYLVDGITSQGGVKG